jgi:hypothetical protein
MQRIAERFGGELHLANLDCFSRVPIRHSLIARPTEVVRERCALRSLFSPRTVS